jgi:transcriptional regulator with XRE-family HTH domain
LSRVRLGVLIGEAESAIQAFEHGRRPLLPETLAAIEGAFPAAEAAVGREAPAVTATQCRRTREMLGWSAEKLGSQGQVGKKTVRRLESREGPRPRQTSVAAICAAFEAAGVEFTDGDAPGLRLRNMRP